MEAIKYNLKRLLNSCFFILIITSCSVVGLTDGYSKLSHHSKSLVWYSSKGLEGEDSSLIKMVNGKELLNTFSEDKVNVVYTFTYYCTSERCYPLSTIRNALPKDCDFYVVTRVLSPEVLKLAKEYRMYGMDKYFYKSRYLFRYEDRFFNDLTGRNNSEQDTLHLYVFNGRRFSHTTDLEGLSKL